MLEDRQLKSTERGKAVSTTETTNPATDSDIKTLTCEVQELLTKHKELSASRIAYILKLNFYKMQDVLNDLEDDGLIQKTMKGKSTYWRLT